jgi:cytochrome c556
MTRTRLRRAMFGLSFATLLSASVVVHADDQEVVDYREHIMKTMGEQAAAIGMILQQKAPADNFAVHVQILAVTAATAKKAFEPKVQGGNAKPEVWTNWTDFAQRLDALTMATADLAKLAQSGGVAAAGSKVQATLTCKGCHDTYRVPKK